MRELLLIPQLFNIGLRASHIQPALVKLSDFGE